MLRVINLSRDTLWAQVLNEGVTIRKDFAHPDGYLRLEALDPVSLQLDNPEIDPHDTTLLLMNDHEETVRVDLPGSGRTLFAPPGRAVRLQGQREDGWEGGLRLDLKAATRQEHLAATGQLWYVNEYLENRYYGGAEEGGWYDDCGTFVECHGTFEDRAAAKAARDGLAGYLEEARQGCYPPSSVLCAGWPAIVIQKHPGADYPAKRLTYA